MSQSFFSRWAKRKQEVSEGKAGEEVQPSGEPPSPPSDKLRAGQASPVSGRGGEPPNANGGALPSEAHGVGDAKAPPPTLEDAEALEAGADIRRFVASDVPADVKNTAFRKLFSDPHFNVMDGLDTYIDDYSKPDPIPQSMLRKLASARFLDLFDERKNEEEAARKLAEQEASAAPSGREVVDGGGEPTVAQSITAEQAVPPPTGHHDHPDLRLQQDDAPGREGDRGRPE